MNFFLADVRDGLGPYLAIYLLTIQKWDAGSIGLVMSIGGIAGLLAQTPAGALIDATYLKRGIVIGAAILVTGGALLLPFLPQFSFVALVQAVTGASEPFSLPR
jgi:predicted MFS family arabinose efflux permease